jgi:hypothetical protein
MAFVAETEKWLRGGEPGPMVFASGILEVVDYFSLCDGFPK